MHLIECYDSVGALITHREKGSLVEEAMQMADGLTSSLRNNISEGE